MNPRGGIDLGGTKIQAVVVDEAKAVLGVAQARNLPGWAGSYPLAPELARLTGAPVALGNDVNVATGAEAELGHVVVRIGGRLCPCGRRGCLEAYAGRGAMEVRARKLGEPYRERIEAAMLPHLFGDDDPPAVRLAALGDLGGAIGAALLALPGRGELVDG